MYRRLLRYTFNGLTLLSALLFVAVCVLWARSHFVRDEVLWTRSYAPGGQGEGVWRRFQLRSARGTVMAAELSMFRGYARPAPGRAGRGGRWRLNVRSSPLDEPPVSRPIFGPREDPRGAGYEDHETAMGNATYAERVAWAPTWTLLLPAAPALTVWGWRFARRRRRRNRGLCPACGYDLRATPGRCPECGRAATSAGGRAGPKS